MSTDRLSSDSDLSIGSLDAISLYPSLKTAECQHICYDMIIKSNLMLKGLKWKPAAQYLAVVMSDSENPIVMPQVSSQTGTLIWAKNLHCPT